MYLEDGRNGNGAGHNGTTDIEKCDEKKSRNSFLDTSSPSRHSSLELKGSDFS
jgi:hypothetical protein